MREYLNSIKTVLQKTGLKINNIYIGFHHYITPPDERVKKVIERLPRRSGIYTVENFLILKDRFNSLFFEVEGDIESARAWLEGHKFFLKTALGFLEKHFLYQETIKIIESLNEIKEIPEVFRLIPEKICKLVRADKGVIALYDPFLNYVYAIEPGYNTSFEEIEILRAEMNENTIAYHAYKSRKVCCLNDAQNSPYLIGRIAKHFKVERVCVAPLFRGRKLFGFIYVGRIEGSYPFDEHEKHLLEFASRQIMSLLRFLKTYEDAVKRYKVLNHIKDATRIILSEMSVQKIMDLTVKLACEIFDVDAASIMMLDENKGGFVVKTAWGLSEKYIKNQFIPLERVRFNFNKLIETPVYIRNLQDTPYGDHNLIVEEGLVSVLSQGIFVDDKPYGILNLYTKKERYFDEIEKEMLVPFAMEIGVALKNSVLYKNCVNTSMELIKTLAALESEKDYYTANHSERVARIAVLIGERCGLRGVELERLYLAGLLHDIGKVAIDSSILVKESPLTQEEKAILKEHPIVGKRIIEKIPNMDKVALCVKYHHERYDGEGYPDRLKGEEIPLCARILCIADSIEAMLSDRPYRKALPKEKVIQELIKEKGKQFDPGLVDIAIEVLKEIN